MFRIGEIGQWAGMAASLGGFIVEAATGADIGFVLITAGSLIWAIATKVKYYRGRKGETHGARSRGGK